MRKEVTGMGVESKVIIHSKHPFFGNKIAFFDAPSCFLCFPLCHLLNGNTQIFGVATQ
jgi:hypothetical protein